MIELDWIQPGVFEMFIGLYIEEPMRFISAPDPIVWNALDCVLPILPNQPNGVLESSNGISKPVVVRFCQYMFWWPSSLSLVWPQPIFHWTISIKLPVCSSDQEVNHKSNFKIFLSERKLH